MLEWRYSDGSASRRPPGVSFVMNKDREGNVNFYRPVPDTEEASVSWRREIGTYLGTELGLPGECIRTHLVASFNMFECSG